MLTRTTRGTNLPRSRLSFYRSTVDSNSAIPPHMRTRCVILAK